MKINKLILSYLLVSIVVNFPSSNVLATSNLERYEILQGNSITINDNTQLSDIDVEVIGNTIINHSNIKSHIASKVPSYNRRPTIKPGRTYTFSGNISEVNNGPFEGAILRIIFDDGSFITPMDRVYTEGDFKVVFTIPTGKKIDYFYIGWIRGEGSNQSAKLDNLMILDGDYTDKPLPMYFEGIKSVGENETNNSLILKSSNKNLFTVNSLREESVSKTNNNVNIEDDVDYTTYQENTKKLTLNKPLRGLPNGVADRVIKINGKWFIERSLKEVVIDGDTNKYIYTIIQNSNSNMTSFSIKSTEDDSKKGQQDREVLSDKIPLGTGWYRDRDYYSISGYADDTAMFVGSIPTFYLEDNSYSSLLKFFRENPTKVVYQLETPIYEPLNIDSTLNLYEGVTYISNNSDIPATMKVMIDRVVNIAKEKMKLAKSNPTVDNISQARYWANLIDDSIVKDQLQEEINTISNVIDMTMEKKTASANVDVYIKSENALSLSLNTNNVTFEDFSGVDDMEKQNAVNLIVSSSLPYKVNAYLASEIQNADKSKTMDKRILNIKVNSETLYHTFTDTVSPIMLLDNQSKDNNILHGIDLKLKGNIAHKKDVYKTTIKFEVEQK